MIIISLVERILLYAIPELGPAHEDPTSHVVTVTPLAVHEESGTQKQNVLWDSFCAHHMGDRLFTAGATEKGFDLIILPPAGQREGVIHRHALGAGDFGPSRVIWSNANIWTSGLDLFSCTHFTRHDNHVGYMRLGRSRSSDPSRISCIPIDEGGDILDLAWDEQSGLLFLLVTLWEDHEEEIRRLIMVELI